MFKSKASLINIKAAPIASPSRSKALVNDPKNHTRSETDSIIEEIIRAAKAKEQYLNDRKIKLGIIKVEEEPPNIIKI